MYYRYAQGTRGTTQGTRGTRGDSKWRSQPTPVRAQRTPVAAQLMPVGVLADAHPPQIWRAVDVPKKKWSVAETPSTGVYPYYPA